MSLIKKYGLDKPEIKILGSLALIMVALCVIAFLSNRNSKRVEASTNEVENLQEIKFDIQEILAVSTDLETGARGYVITGDEKYLEPSNKAIGSIFQHINNLKDAEENNPIQLNRIKELEGLMDQKVTHSTRAIEIRRDKGVDEAILFISQNNGQEVMDKIRSIAGRLLGETDLLLKQKTSENKQNFKDFNLTFNLLLAKIAISIISVFFVLRYYFNTRRKSEEEIKQTNDFLNSILENIPDMVFVKDAKELRFVRFNKAGEKLLGYPRQDLIGKNDYDFFPIEQADFFIKKDREVIKRKELVEIKEEPIDTKNGKRWLHTKKIVLTDENGKANYLMGISADITEQKEMMERLKSSSQEIIDLFNNAPCGYLSTDKHGIVIEMNETLLKWLGYSREEVIGKMPTQDLMAEDSLHIFTYYFPKIRTGEIKSLHDIEVRFKRQDDTFFPALVNSICLYDTDGSFLKTRTSIFDITVLKKAESLFMQN